MGFESRFSDFDAREVIDAIGHADLASAISNALTLNDHHVANALQRGLAEWIVDVGDHEIIDEPTVSEREVIVEVAFRFEVGEHGSCGDNPRTFPATATATVIFDRTTGSATVRAAASSLQISRGD